MTDKSFISFSTYPYQNCKKFQFWQCVIITCTQAGIQFRMEAEGIEISKKRMKPSVCS